MKPKQHPAKYSDVLLPVMAEMLAGRVEILDPFAGTGKIVLLREDRASMYGVVRGLKGAKFTLVELESEWAEQAKAQPHFDPLMDTVHIMDARRLPELYALEVDAICTSPAYGNRMADHHDAKDGSRRMTYTHCLGRKLTPGNSGELQWGDAYKALHYEVWYHCVEALRPGGIFVLNCSDHIRGGEVQPVTAFHLEALEKWGLQIVLYAVAVKTPRMRFGQNANLRCASESVTMLWKPTQEGAPVPAEVSATAQQVERLSGIWEAERAEIRTARRLALPEFRAYQAKREAARMALDAAARAGFSPEDHDWCEQYRRDRGAWAKLKRRRRNNYRHNADAQELLESVASQMGRHELKVVAESGDLGAIDRALRSAIQPWLERGRELSDFIVLEQPEEVDPLG